MKALPKILILVVTMLVGLTAYAQTTATATATRVGQFIVSVTVTDGGSGYTFPPSVTFSGGSGSDAGAYSVISNGVVTDVMVTNAGSGYTSTPSVTISAPVTGNYSFRSGSAYIEVPDSVSLDSTTNQLTVECWFNRASDPGDWNAIVSKDPNNLSSDNYELRFYANDPVGTLHLASGNPDISDMDTTLNPIYPQWHHYALQFDGTNSSVWLDGQLVFSLTNTPGQLTSSSNPLSIGSQNNGLRSFDGYLDEVRISKTIRYHSAFTPEARFSTDTNTIALYHFDEDGGTTVYDSSGNGNDGTVYNVDSNTWSTNVPPVITISPAVISLNKAVYLSFSNLFVGTNYQVQVSSNLSGPWNNFGTPFAATNSIMTYSNYWNVNDWNALFFRLTQ